jgi:hypothetical protein
VHLRTSSLEATQAAIRAGYSAKTAKVIGAQNLTKLNIAAAIEKARTERAELTGDMVFDELRKIAGANMADYMKSTAARALSAAIRACRRLGRVRRCAPWVGSDAEGPTWAFYRRAFAHLVARTAAAIETVRPDSRCQRAARQTVVDYTSALPPRPNA